MLGVAPAPCPGWVRRSWGSAVVGGSALAWDSAPWACGAVLRLPWASGRAMDQCPARASALAPALWQCLLAHAAAACHPVCSSLTS